MRKRKPIAPRLYGANALEYYLYKLIRHNDSRWAPGTYDVFLRLQHALHRKIRRDLAPIIGLLEHPNEEA